MDKRETFDNTDSLKNILAGLYQQKQKASFLIDQDGLTRLEGIITDMHQQDDATTITVGDKLIRIKQIIAVNGIFRGDYTEC
jgi:hypothetical protein